MKRLALLLVSLVALCLGCRGAPQETSPAPGPKFGSIVPTPVPYNPSWSLTDIYVDPQAGSDTTGAGTSVLPFATPDAVVRLWGTCAPTWRVKQKLHFVTEQLSAGHGLRICGGIMADGGGLQVILPQITVTGGTLGTVTAKNRTATFPLLRANLAATASTYAGQQLLDTTDSTIAWIDEKGLTGSTTTGLNFTQPAVSAPPVSVHVADDTWMATGSTVLIGGCQYLVNFFQDTANVSLQNTGTGTCPSPGATVSSGAAVTPLSSTATILSQPYPVSTSWATSGLTFPGEVNTIAGGHGYSVVRPGKVWIDELTVSYSGTVTHLDDEFGLLINADVQPGSPNNAGVAIRGMLAINSKIERPFAATSPAGYSVNNDWLNDYFTNFPNFFRGYVAGGVITTGGAGTSSQFDGDVVVHGSLTIRGEATSSLGCTFLEGGGGPTAAVAFVGYGSGITGCSGGLYGPYGWNAAYSGLIYWNDNGQTPQQAFGTQSQGLEINGTGIGWAIDRRVSPLQTIGPRTITIASLATSIDSGGFLVPGNGSGAFAVSDRSTGIISETARFSQPATTQAPLAGNTYLPGPAGTCLESDGGTVFWGSCTVSDAGAAFFQTLQNFNNITNGPYQEPILSLAYNGPGSRTLVDQPGSNRAVDNLIVQAYTKSQLNGGSLSAAEPNINYINAQSVFDNPGNLSTDITFSSQVIELGGSPLTRRQKLNFVAGTNETITASDNGSDTTTLTVASTAGGGSSFYQQMKSNGSTTGLTQRPNLNFIGGQVTDDVGNASTDVTLFTQQLQNNTTNITKEPNLSFQGLDTKVTGSTIFASAAIMYSELDNSGATPQTFTNSVTAQVTFDTPGLNLTSQGFGDLSNATNANNITATSLSGIAGGNIITVECEFTGAAQTVSTYTAAAFIFGLNGSTGGFGGVAFPIPGTGPGYAPITMHASGNLNNGDRVGLFGQFLGFSGGSNPVNVVGELSCRRML